MKSRVCRASHALFLQFTFLLLKNGFQANEILASRAFCRQSRDRRFDKQAELENVMKREVVQRVCQFFRPAAGHEASRAMAADDQSLQLHRPKSLANRRPAGKQTFGESKLRGRAVIESGHDE